MNVSYKAYLDSEGDSEDIQGLKDYLLARDTIIIPEMWELICSPGVSKKIHEDPNIIKDKYIYRDGDTIYFIYSKYFEGVGDVKVFFDTTQYIKSQIIIIKTGLIFIFLVFILQFFTGRYISWKLLKNLKNISDKVKILDIDSQKKHITCLWMPVDDEIRILAEALNTSYDMIDQQTWKLKQFLTDVSHEFKTPLMWMSSELDVLEKKDEKWVLRQDDINMFFSHSRRNISKLNWLLETLFFISRIGDKSSCLVTKDLKVEKYLEKKLMELSESFAHKDISYELNISEKLVYNVEESTFSILLDNLISNAIKFSPQKVELKIIADEKQFSIEDNGPWISLKNRKKIWDKFYRSDTKIEWFGIWLYLVKRIVDIYKWDIFLESKKWSGAKFIVKI